MSAMCVCVPGAQYSFWRSNQFPFLVVWPTGLHFWRESEINSRCYWRCVLSWQVLFQQRIMRISWRLCNNSEIHLWLWKVWSLLVCSQSSFYVTRARKDYKNRQNNIFFAKKMNLVPNKQLLLNVPFQLTKYKKNEFCVENKVQEINGDVFCPTCRNEKCVKFSTKRTTNFYDCQKCKTCCHVLNIPFKDQKPTIMLFGGVMDHIVLQERRVATTQSHLHFWRNFSANHNQAHPNLNQRRLKWVQIKNKRIRFLLADDLSDIFIFQTILFGQI